MSADEHGNPSGNIKGIKRSNRIIQLHHECEGGIEKYVLKITDWYHDVCRVMTHGDCDGQIFLSHPHPIMDSFSCSPLYTSFYIGKHVKDYQKVLNTLIFKMVT